MEAQQDEQVSKVGPAPGPRGRSRIKSLIVLVACFGALAWSWRAVQEGMRPALGWAKQLRDGDVDSRQVAARELAESSMKDYGLAIRSLVGARDDPNEQVRASVASALGIAGLRLIQAEAGQAELKELGRVLTEALKDDKAEVRIAAADALASIATLVSKADSETRPALPFDPEVVASSIVGILNDPDMSTRDQARASLSRIVAATSIKPPASLLEGLGRWEAEESRASAALALGTFKEGAEATILALAGALKDKGPEVRSYSAYSLQKFAAAASPSLPSLMANLGDPFVPTPPSVPGASGGEGRPAVNVNAPIPPRPTGVDPAVEAVNAIGRISAGQMAGGVSPSDEVVGALLQAFRSDRPAIQAAAEQALRRIAKGALAAIPGLLEDLTEATSGLMPGRGAPAAALLGAIAPGTPSAPKAIASLAAALDSKDKATRINSAAALGRFGPAASDALPRLGGLAGDPDKDLASAAQGAADRVEGKVPVDAPRRKNAGGTPRRP